MYVFNESDTSHPSVKEDNLASDVLPHSILWCTARLNPSGFFDCCTNSAHMCNRVRCVQWDNAITFMRPITAFPSATIWDSTDHQEYNWFNSRWIVHLELNHLLTTVWIIHRLSTSRPDSEYITHHLALTECSSLDGDRMTLDIWFGTSLICAPPQLINREIGCFGELYNVIIGWTFHTPHVTSIFIISIIIVMMEVRLSITATNHKHPIFWFIRLAPEFSYQTCSIILWVDGLSLDAPYRQPAAGQTLRPQKNRPPSPRRPPIHPSLCSTLKPKKPHLPSRGLWTIFI